MQRTRRYLPVSSAAVSYALLQIPDILAAGVVLYLLHAWGIVGRGWAVGLFALWVVKDIAMYPLLRGVLVPRGTEQDPVVGASGLAQEPLAPRGQVRVRGEYWQAESRRPGEAIPAGTSVVVVGRRGITVLVEPLAGNPQSDGEAGES